MPIRPSAATRPAFLAALDRPFLRSQSCAACMSPLLSVSAALQSIMPAPVDFAEVLDHRCCDCCHRCKSRRRVEQQGISVLLGIPGIGSFGIYISWWLVVWIAVAAAAIFGIMLGAPTLKLRGDYPAIVTLGFGEIVRFGLPRSGRHHDRATGVPRRRRARRAECEPHRGYVGNLPDRPTHASDTRAVGQSDRVLEPECDRVLVPDPRRS